MYGLDLEKGLTLAQAWLLPLAALAAAVLVALLMHRMLLNLLRRLVARIFPKRKPGLFSRLHGPSRLMLVLLWCGIGLTALPPPEPLLGWLRHLLLLCWILSVAWLCVNLSLFVEGVLVGRLEDGDNLTTRKMLTQFTALQRIFAVLVALLALAAMLMSFEAMRNLGMSLLASAGLAGIVIGFSAQRTVATIFAGIQIAFTQPIRLDDVVIVENEWGRVEEITFTFVVIRIWDQRRLVVPINHFLEKPFQNWTRVSADILGTVFIYADFSVHVNDVRLELSRICLEEGSALWDGKVCNLQVTDVGPQGVELRCLVSAKDSSRAWDLRCLVRERLVAWLARTHPQCLPLQRWRQERPMDGWAVLAGRAAQEPGQDGAA